MKKKVRRRSAADIARRNARQKSHNMRVWLMIGLAVFFLIAVLYFRRGCGRKIASFYDSLTPERAQADGGVSEGRPRPQTGRPAATR
jgi:hypothetical protein